MTLTGLHVPLITPFQESGEVDLASLESLSHEILDGGATGIVALGTTAEPASLTHDEKLAVLDVIRSVCRERSAPVIAGFDLAGPHDAAALVLVPPFVRPGEAGVIEYFRHLPTTVPIVAYHVPHRTAQPLSLAALRQLASLPGVVGIKHAPEALDADTVALLADPPPGFAVLCGTDAIVSPMLALGAPGAILASAHIETLNFTRLVEAWRSGDLAAARPLGHRLSRLSATLFSAPNPTVIKAALHSHGRIKSPHVRLPLLAPAGNELTALIDVLTP